MRSVALVLLLLCLAWLSQACGVADPTPRDTAANCGAWDDMRRGVVSCERAGDKCAYGADFERRELDSKDASWLCTCGTDVQIYWCKSTQPAQIEQAVTAPAVPCEVGEEIGVTVVSATNPGLNCPRLRENVGGIAAWCCL